MGFDDDTAVRPLEGGAYGANIEPTWWTPRGPLGGYLMAIALRAMQRAADDDARQARSLTMHFLRPPDVGPVTVHPVVERQGRTLTTVSARVEQEGRALALALGAFSVPWPSPTLTEPTMPEGVEPFEPDRPFENGLPAEGRPPFTEQVITQWRLGPPPFSRADRAEVGGWVGLREAREVDALTLAVLADVWFPTPWPRLAGPANAPTIDLTVHFRAPLPLPASASPLLGRFRTRLVRDGFFEEDGELWTADGTLVAQSRQLGLLIDAQA